MVGPSRAVSRASRSLVVVLPAEPVTPITVASGSVRGRAVARPAERGQGVAAR